MPHEFLLPVHLHKGPHRLVYFLLEQDRIITPVALCQFCFDVIRQVWASHQPLIRAAGLIIDFADFGVHSLLVDELDRRQEIVQGNSSRQYEVPPG